MQGNRFFPLFLSFKILALQGVMKWNQLETCTVQYNNLQPPVTTEHLKGGQFKMRYAVSIKYTAISKT